MALRNQPKTDTKVEIIPFNASYNMIKGPRTVQGGIRYTFRVVPIIAGKIYEFNFVEDKVEIIAFASGRLVQTLNLSEIAGFGEYNVARYNKDINNNITSDDYASYISANMERIANLVVGLFDSDRAVAKASMFADPAGYLPLATQNSLF